MSGRSTSGSFSLGTALAAGRNRVSSAPAGITTLRTMDFVMCGCAPKCAGMRLSIVRRSTTTFIPASRTRSSGAWNKVGNRPSVSLFRGANCARGKSVARNRSSNVIVLPHRYQTRLRIAALRWRSHRDARACGSEVPPVSTISDYDLHAFVDNALDATRRTRVQAFFLQHPAAAADAAAYCRQNRMLRELKRPATPNAPALGYLAAQLAARLTCARIGRATAYGAAAVVIAVAAWVLVSGGWVA